MKRDDVLVTLYKIHYTYLVETLLEKILAMCLFNNSSASILYIVSNVGELNVMEPFVQMH